MSIALFTFCSRVFQSVASSLFSRRLRAALLLALFALLALPGRAQTTYTVTDTSDSSTDSGSIRYAVNKVNADTGTTSDTIDFSGAAASGTITLTGTLTLSRNVTISGPGANLLTISCGGAVTVFTVNSGVTVNISGLTITGGGGSGLGSGIYNQGTLAVSNSTLSGNTTGSTNGFGGGIYNSSGTLTVSNSTFSNNTTSNSGGGGGIANANGILAVSNSTFFGNTAASGNGGGIYSQGTLTVSNSTFSGNSASNSGGGIFNQPGSSTTITDSIVAGNTTTGNPGDDCDSCALSGKNLVSTPGNIQTPMLGPLDYNGANQSVQTLLPLPGSPAIEAGLASTLTTDERGITRPTGSGVVSDLGAVQTNYTGVQFVQQATNTLINATMTPAVTLSVIESGAAAVNIPVPLTFSGNGALAGTLTETTAPGANGTPAIASYSNLSVNAAGTGDTLNVSLPITAAGITPALTLAATSSFDITVQATTITWTQTPPASVVYGAAPIKLAATATSGATVSYQVVSGPATITGNTLSFTGVGTVVIEAYTAASGSYGAGSLTSNIVVTQAPQTITFPAIAAQVFGSAPFAVSATSTSGLPVTIAKQSGPATISGNTVTLTGVGTVVLVATQTGNTNYSAATPVTQSFVVSAATVPVTPSYTMTANPTSLTIAAGATGTTTITFTPVGGYTGSLTLSCGTLPAFTKCAFTQGTAANSTVTMNGSNTPITVTLTIATNVATAMNVLPSILQTPGTRPEPLLAASKPPTPMNPILPALAFWCPGGLAGLAVFGRKRKLTGKQRRFLQLGLLVLLTGALAAGISGCSYGGRHSILNVGGNGTPTAVTPSGTSTVIITAVPASGSAQTLNLSLTITG